MLSQLTESHRKDSPLTTSARTDSSAKPFPASVRVDESGSLPRLLVSSARGTGVVYFQGAHVASWQPPTERTPVLWTSERSLFEPGKPIRGGVPICFPWFGPNAGDPSAPMHGFARIRPWALVAADEAEDGTVTVELALTGRELSPAWPHAFRVTHRVRFGTSLRMDLVVHNPGPEAFTFEEALHSYFAVADVRHVAVGGLEGVEFVDKTDRFARKRQGAEPMRIAGETDRVYLDTRAACVIEDPDGRRRITVAKQNSDATVVWNPWVAKAKAMPDFGDEEWPAMLCVETCNVAGHARTLAPGESHVMTATIEVTHGGR
jgi:glucose-6-phosphate 1-epimerase